MPVVTGDILGLMDTRARMAADAIGSVQAEGLEPGVTVIEILDRWCEGMVETEQLGEAAQCLATGESVAHLLKGVGPRFAAQPPGRQPPNARSDREGTRPT
jgi:hypothetical protein